MAPNDQEVWAVMAGAGSIQRCSHVLHTRALRPGREHSSTTAQWNMSETSEIHRGGEAAAELLRVGGLPAGEPDP